jgi:hypothetical protein
MRVSSTKRDAISRTARKAASSSPLSWRRSSSSSSSFGLLDDDGGLLAGEHADRPKEHLLDRSARPVGGDAAAHDARGQQFADLRTRRQVLEQRLVGEDRQLGEPAAGDRLIDVERVARERGEDVGVDDRVLEVERQERLDDHGTIVTQRVETVLPSVGEQSHHAALGEHGRQVARPGRREVRRRGCDVDQQERLALLVDRREVHLGRIRPVACHDVVGIERVVAEAG